jgi:hypothetical protein
MEGELQLNTEALMRAATRWLDWIGPIALVLAMLLASPGVRVSRAEADFSYDPALEAPPAEVAPSGALTGTVAVGDSGSACEGTGPAVVPSLRSLTGMPLLGPDGQPADPSITSLNNRGYNIGKADPSEELQRLLMEVRRQQAR